MTTSNSTFYHFYDLEFAPPTFNFVDALILSELARTTLTACTQTEVIFVPGSNDGFNKLDTYDVSVKWGRFWSILIPSLGLCPSVRSFHFLSDRQEAQEFVDRAGANIFPLGYSLENAADCCQPTSVNLNFALGYEIPSIRAPEIAHQYVAQTLNTVQNSRPFVTITLRQAQYLPARNSDLEMWQAVSQFMQEQGYLVIVLPDYEAVFDFDSALFPGAYVSRDCVLNLHMRVALYEQASLNLGQAGGPLLCCVFNDKCNYVFANLIVPGVGHSTVEALNATGYAIDKDSSFYETFARWIWSDTNKDSLISVCEEFINKSKAGLSLQSEQRLNAVDVYSALEPSLGSDAISFFIKTSSDSKKHPIFVNRERTPRAERDKIVRFFTP